MCNFQLWMCVDESDGCGRVSPAPVCLCARNERKGAKRMVGEVDGGVRKKVLLKKDREIKWKKKTM
mgnify:CR=1 FL=1